jgi:hypothetical protein
MITTQNAKVVFEGNGGTIQFVWNFQTIESVGVSQIRVFKKNIDLTIEEITDKCDIDFANKKIVYPNSPLYENLQTGEKLIIARVLDYVQPLNLILQGEYDKRDIEKELDYLTCLTQQNADGIPLLLLGMDIEEIVSDMQRLIEIVNTFDGKIRSIEGEISAIAKDADVPSGYSIQQYLYFLTIFYKYLKSLQYTLYENLYLCIKMEQ